MIKFSEWLKVKESSSATRIKTQAALGLAPPVADIFSRATPPPWQVKRLKKALKKSHKKKKRKSHMLDEASKSKPINLEFDKFLKSVEALAKDIYELKTAEKRKEVLDKMKSITKKIKKDKEDKDENSDKLEKNKTDKSKTDKSKKTNVKKIKKVKVIGQEDKDN